MKTWIAMTAAALITFGLSSGQAKASSDLALVQSWYQDHLGRSGQLCELGGWARQLRTGATPCAVQAGILGSDEYYHLHGCTASGFVAGLYADVLGRQACSQEIQGWVCRLGRCGCRQTLAQEFLNAAQIELAQRN